MIFGKLRIKLLERSAFNAFALSQFDKAAAAFEKLIALAPGRRGGRFNLGLALLAGNQWDAALGYFRQEADLFGETFPLVKAMAEAAYLKGERAAAREHYERALGQADSPSERNFCSLRLAICGSPERFAQARHARGLIDQGDAHMLRREYDAAEELFREATRLDPTSFQAMNNLGAIRLAKKDYASAQEYFQMADKIAELPMVKKNLAYLAKQRGL
ncbi:hypothetical protein DESUT3_19710 [Desulfuromonas versatilis]|uniref:Tetratricopeptide repeat protein n=1 Tax=Desulfuromonas versatilis TaxID=2802975 RepID=A0ABN6DY09_9BACT|nr:tetratricopeptide repeat protein [Desulfuromonas versatilis]BCR04902.1 hypothetical protein DESUT3_19710 [Desulfuromonas versatilis]